MTCQPTPKTVGDHTPLVKLHNRCASDAHGYDLHLGLRRDRLLRCTVPAQELAQRPEYDDVDPEDHESLGYPVTVEVHRVVDRYQGVARWQRGADVASE